MTPKTTERWCTGEIPFDRLGEGVVNPERDRESWTRGMSLGVERGRRAENQPVMEFR